jgi:hypothetical protein
VGEDLPSIPVPRGIPQLGHSLASAYFISIGTFSLVKKLEVRKVESRCTGICIHHCDGTTEILGQWDPSQPSMISEIYNGNKGFLMATTFHYSGPILPSYMEDITVKIDQVDAPAASHTHYSETFHVSELNKVWYFSAYPSIRVFSDYK